ncbi:MAG: pyrimidine-nucleoside phosphorylase [Bacilli bacterium]
MRMVDLIEKKRNGQSLTAQEIDWIIQGYTKGEIPDYQMSAWLMSVYFQGMTKEETAALTMSMVHSGEALNLDWIPGVKVDKHSTGGVGDTTTLVLAPLVASVGVSVAKMSGRGLGHTGGTIDKLESFPGFSVELSAEKFQELVKNNHLAVIGQSGDLAPADKLMYALRDVTGTVNSIPLIASSIMSKKIAAGADAIVLDVKFGSGAFMKDIEDAKALAQAMVDIGKSVGRNTVALLTNMNEPLGFAIGNVLEVKEAIDTLRGEGPTDLTELCIELGAHMTYFAKKAETIDAARELMKQQIQSGAALAVFSDFITHQGGDGTLVFETERFAAAPYQIPFLSEKDGWISAMESQQIGEAAMVLGAGRQTKESKIDLSVGLVLHKKVGDKVEIGEPILTMYANSEDVTACTARLSKAIEISEVKVVKYRLIDRVID